MMTSISARIVGQFKIRKKLKMQCSIYSFTNLTIKIVFCEIFEIFSIFAGDFKVAKSDVG